MDFLEQMKNLSDQELIKIVTISRNDYQLSAVECAEEEIKNRGIDFNKLEAIKEELNEKNEGQKHLDSSKVNLGIRFLNFVIDSVIWLIVLFILTYPLNPTDTTQYYIGFVILFGTFISYYSILEIKFQKSIGKFITKTKVVTIEGEKPSTSDIFRRTLCRLIPFDWVSFLFSKNGFHDKFSDTIVIKD